MLLQALWLELQTAPLPQVMLWPAVCHVSLKAAFVQINLNLNTLKAFVPILADLRWIAGSSDIIKQEFTELYQAGCFEILETNTKYITPYIFILLCKSRSCI